MNGFSWEGLWGELAKPRDWLGPNFQSGMGGAAKALNPYGTTGNVGEMFQKYIQGVESQKAVENEMKKKQLFNFLITRMLGKMYGSDPSKSSPFSTNYPNEWTSSEGWMEGGK